VCDDPRSAAPAPVRGLTGVAIGFMLCASVDWMLQMCADAVSSAAPDASPEP